MKQVLQCSVSLSNELIFKVLNVPVLHIYCYLSTAVTFMLYCLFGITSLIICVIFVLCLCFSFNIVLGTRPLKPAR